MRYKCHINVEVCSSITVVKYLYKYVYKGTTVLWQWSLEFVSHIDVPFSQVWLRPFFTSSCLR